MRRFYALAIGIAVLLATPALASADVTGRSAMNQQAVNYVISRALAQRGVPFSYGGGDATGPTRGNPLATNVQPEQLSNGLDPQPLSSDMVGDPASKPIGFDASGLVLYAFAGAGLKLPRTSGEQYMASQKILPQQALPGDLIFYGPDGAKSVAMFLGNGQMLQATDPAVVVTPVRTTDMAPYLGRMIA
jgi:cell wall-associated NlpC family hydrolase